MYVTWIKYIITYKKCWIFPKPARGVYPMLFHWAERSGRLTSPYHQGAQMAAEHWNSLWISQQVALMAKSPHRTLDMWPTLNQFCLSCMRAESTKLMKIIYRGPRIFLYHLIIYICFLFRPKAYCHSDIWHMVQYKFDWIQSIDIFLVLVRASSRYILHILVLTCLHCMNSLVTKWPDARSQPYAHDEETLHRCLVPWSRGLSMDGGLHNHDIHVYFPVNMVNTKHLYNICTTW